MLHLISGSAIILGLSLPPSPVVPIDVPRVPPATVVIDGRLDAAEWQRASTHRLSDGTTLRLQHDGKYLFIGITAGAAGFPSVCSARGDSTHVFHASAALGSVTYTGAAGGWTTRDTAFSYGMRNTDTTDQARQERHAYLTQHGWVASTFRMSQGRAHEMQISVDLLDRVPRVALAYFIAGAANAWSIVPWPETMRAQDDCANAELVRGYVPSRLRFAPAEWAELRLGS